MNHIASIVFSNANTLTSIEWSVIRLVGAGLRNRDISRHLALKEPSVRKVLTAIYGKMGIDNRLKAALWYAKYQYERHVQ